MVVHQPLWGVLLIALVLQNKVWVWITMICLQLIVWNLSIHYTTQLTQILYSLSLTKLIISHYEILIYNNWKGSYISRSSNAPPQEDRLWFGKNSKMTMWTASLGFGALTTIFNIFLLSLFQSSVWGSSTFSSMPC